MLKAVIFDLDGVIVSTDVYHFKAWQAVAEKHGLNFDDKLNDRLRGIGREASLKIILDANGKTMNQRRLKRIATAKNRLYRRLLNQLSPKDILPGVQKLLGGLAADGIKTAVGSSSRNTPKILKKIALGKTFGAVVDGNAKVRSKPAPDIFLACAEALGEAPDNCLVLEDAEAGIAAASAAGMTAVGVGKAPLPHADAMLETLLKTDAEGLIAIHQKARR